MIRHNESAVSPVVGVMLMLVVTIIIAAVVSAFAGGLGGDQKKTPSVSVMAAQHIQDIQDEIPTNSGPDYPGGFTAANGIMFENAGGDSFSLDDIQVQLASGTSSTKYTITSADRINEAETCLPAGITTNGGYFQKIGNTSTYDRTITPGDKFIVYADGCRIDLSGKWLTWTPSDATNGFGAQFGTRLKYMILDKISGRTISSGEIVLQ